jgi:hypothetical protein
MNMAEKEHEGKSRVPSEHFKLVSEGGECKAEGPGGQCWSPDQIVAECITPQMMENFRSYNSVCMTLPTNDMYAFSLPLEYSLDLDKGIIPAEMTQEFEAKGAPLTGTAIVNIQYEGRIWFIIDQQKRYSVRMVPTGLLVYSESLL